MALRAPGEDREAEGQQQVLQAINETFHRLAAYCAFPGYLADVQNRTMGETDRLQETIKSAKVPYHALALNLLLNV